MPQAGMSQQPHVQMAPVMTYMQQVRALVSHIRHLSRTCCCQAFISARHLATLLPAGPRPLSGAATDMPS